MSELRDKVRAVLPSAALNLMDEIETFAATKVSIEKDSQPAPIGDPNPTAPSSEVNANRATIYLPDPDVIDPHGILHELLHIHRFWVGQIPQVLPIDRENLSITSRIENALEHLVIVPREAEFGFDPYSHWNESAKIMWSKYPWPGSDQFARRTNCLLSALGVGFLTDPEAIRLVEDGIRKEGLEREAHRFRSRVMDLLPSKPRTISCALRFLGIPNEAATLVYYDVRNRREWRTPVPRH